ncbi:PulJ/GspJ family protein [Paenibacillus sp.]|uniref:PulJ/GspJ family protein n=1 Tax=Paenibacillus sp. TaxID=58172 RepID=UPI002D436B94|nr:prepilin-type N-terminal cleavage/methylation domain-containing protein [Paenibacillus sp.]HZG56045.1 prepilin-type N-terminal cleavage/methylation domain-containing protein [Paenibacillus sp.]
MRPRGNGADAPLRNERGLTLVELLAAVAISAMILAVATLVLANLSHLFSSNAQRYKDDSAIKLTMNTLAAELSNSTRVAFYPDIGELRFLTGDGEGVVYKVAVFDASASRLTIYRFSEADDDGTNDGAHFEDETKSFALHPALYTSPVRLGDNVTSVAYFLSNGNPVPAEPVENGERIEIVAAFETERVKVSGATEPNIEERRRTVKLLAEPAAEP